MRIRIGFGTDGRDDRCECCGYPFDHGDVAFDMTDGMGPLACSMKCADWLEEEELRRVESGADGVPGNTLACFV